MERIEVSSDRGFRVTAGTDRSQAATMVLAPGEVTGGPTNHHEESDQWLYVKSGAGVAEVDGEEYELREGDLALIEPGENHEIRNEGDEPFVTVNVYAPPEY
jgi:mannose-6-phosphate isomerase-like protein (cupin superfamily)